ncbi:hypothetical protein OG21DRAFT_563099 [Imleria badia]|nr:hypothetical protein OG21DRAFT_563099 [Imleria badia]
MSQRIWPGGLGVDGPCPNARFRGLASLDDRHLQRRHITCQCLNTSSVPFRSCVAISRRYVVCFRQRFIVATSLPTFSPHELFYFMSGCICCEIIDNRHLFSSVLAICSSLQEQDLVSGNLSKWLTACLISLYGPYLCDVSVYFDGFVSLRWFLYPDNTWPNANDS